GVIEEIQCPALEPHGGRTLFDSATEKVLDHARLLLWSLAIPRIPETLNPDGCRKVLERGSGASANPRLIYAGSSGSGQRLDRLRN
ncbi:MAG TPA: hypothetical protein DCS75_04685, partial [Gemmatimonadetes bacterium]|nr:hypothetical protein [Gemmatimonadota bacterium]